MCDGNQQQMIAEEVTHNIKTKTKLVENLKRKIKFLNQQQQDNPTPTIAENHENTIIFFMKIKSNFLDGSLLLLL